MTTQEAINYFGSIRQMALHLDIWPHSVYRWGDYPPMAKQYEIQVKTNGELLVTPPEVMRDAK